MTENTQLPEEEVCKSIEYILDTWRRMAGWLQFGLITMGFLAIACSVCIGAFTDEIGSLATKILASCATLFLTLISSFSLASKASNVRDGWRHLNKAMFSYKTKSIDIAALIKAYEEGEKILGTVEFNYDKSQFNKSKPSADDNTDTDEGDQTKDKEKPNDEVGKDNKNTEPTGNKASDENVDDKTKDPIKDKDVEDDKKENGDTT